MAKLDGETQVADIHAVLCGAACLRGAVQQSAGAAVLPSHAEACRPIKHFLLPKVIYFYKTIQMDFTHEVKFAFIYDCHIPFHCICTSSATEPINQVK